MKTYDLIISIGEACSCTETLRACGLQRFSYPFDWLFGNNFEGRINLLLNDMKNFINLNDLEKEGTRLQPMPCTIYKNIKNNIVFNHDFPLNAGLEESYPSVAAQYKRRINRMYSEITQSEKVLFVYIETPNCKEKLNNNKILLSLQEKLQTKFKNTQIDILYISNKNKHKNIQLSQNILKIETDYTNSDKSLPPYTPNYAKLKAILSDYKLSDLLKDKKEKELISILIPAYNHEKYIQDSIRSVLNQTYEPIELIIIDDGSTDNTWDKICELEEECRQKLANVIFKTRKNKGICDTLNELIITSSGKYISLLASDDKYKPEAIETLYEFLSQNLDYALAVGDNELINENGNRIFWDKNGKYTNLPDSFKTFAEFYQNKVNLDFSSSKFGTYEEFYKYNYVPNGYLIRRNIFKKTGYYTKKAPLDDWYILLQISKYSKMKFINKILLEYRQHTTNTMINTHKIEEMTLKTRNYENEIIKTIDKNQLLPDVKTYIEKLLCDNYEKTVINLPPLITIKKKRINSIKKLQIKFLGIKINLKKKGK